MTFVTNALRAIGLAPYRKVRELDHALWRSDHRLYIAQHQAEERLKRVNELISQKNDLKAKLAERDTVIAQRAEDLRREKLVADDCQHRLMQVDRIINPTYEDCEP